MPSCVNYDIPYPTVHQAWVDDCYQTRRLCDIDRYLVEKRVKEEASDVLENSGTVPGSIEAVVASSSVNPLKQKSLQMRGVDASPRSPAYKKPKMLSSKPVSISVPRYPVKKPEMTPIPPRSKRPRAPSSAVSLESSTPTSSTVNSKQNLPQSSITKDRKMLGKMLPPSKIPSVGVQTTPSKERTTKTPASGIPFTPRTAQRQSPVLNPSSPLAKPLPASPSPSRSYTPPIPMEHVRKALERIVEQGKLGEYRSESTYDEIWHSLMKTNGNLKYTKKSYISKVKSVGREMLLRNENVAKIDRELFAKVLNYKKCQKYGEKESQLSRKSIYVKEKKVI